jgi:hypothetical protein
MLGDSDFQAGAAFAALVARAAPAIVGPPQTSLSTSYLAASTGR